MLQDARDADQAAASSEAESLRKQVIYAMHVLRYAGGRDSGSFGFGVHASSYYGKGNSLTGVDTLDNFRLQNAYGYAQVADVGAPILKLNDDAENRDRQEVSLLDAKYGFDAMIQACRDSFAGRTADEQDASQAAMEQLYADLDYAHTADEARLAQLIADAEGAFAGANNAMQANLHAVSDAAVAAFQADIDEEKARVGEWFADQSEWAAKLYDSYYKEHLLESLAAKRDSTWAALDARAATAAANADAANAQLADDLDSAEAANAAFNAATMANMIAFNDALQADTAAAAAAIDAQFSADADAEHAAKNAAMDQLTEDWAYWLKYQWGFSGYDTALYANYDDTVDYSRGSDGAFPVTGYQGNNGQSFGSDQSGFGYGGIGGTDYLSSADSTRLAYGSVTGPSPKYFDDSILDPADALRSLSHGYSESWGAQYW